MKVKTLSWSSEKSNENIRQVVEEGVLGLSVNGRELVRLIASPHQPEQLIIGFLYLQGLVSSLDDIVTLGICADSGHATVSVRGEVPERISPTLTSGCGGGISFDDLAMSNVVTDSRLVDGYRPGFVFDVMSELLVVAEQYTEHGGIHSAALCDHAGLLLHAEDIGRHNSIDRVAGQVLRQGVDAGGRLLVTSGRISSEMVVKAVRMGVSALASRTSPTSLAVELCERFNIGLAGYVRGGKMEIYANRGRFAV